MRMLGDFSFCSLGRKSTLLLNVPFHIVVFHIYITMPQIFGPRAYISSKKKTVSLLLSLHYHNVNGILLWVSDVL